MNPESIMLGKYSLPVLLSLILGLIYKRTTIPDDLKPYISVGAGIALGVAAIFYNEVSPITFAAVTDYVLAGGVAGAAATGIYEMSKPAVKNRYIPIDENGKRIEGARVAKTNAKILG